MSKAVGKKAIRDFYRTLKSKQKEDAFVALADLLIDMQWLSLDKEGNMCWKNTGMKINQ